MKYIKHRKPRPKFKKFNHKIHIISILFLSFITFQLLNIRNDISRLSTNNKFLAEQLIGIENLKDNNYHQRQKHLEEINSLKKVSAFLEKHNLEYWLDFGTLLGAVRQKGFIPWDNDIDIAMMRKDHEKLREILLKSQGVPFRFNPSGRIFLYGIDIYSYDFVAPEHLKTVRTRQKIRKNLFFRILPTKVRNIFITNTWKKYYTEDAAIIVPGPEYWLHDNLSRVMKKEDVFPLIKMRFEDRTYNVPNNYRSYLSGIYNNYMSFPSSFGSKK